MKERRSPTRRSFVSALAGAALCGRGARAADDKARPLRMIVPQAPGGAADFTARLVAEDLSSRLGRLVIVDNRPGGGMIVGTHAIAMAAPDGNTFGMVLTPHAINQAMRRHMPYHALEDFEPVCLGGHSIIVLVAHPRLPVRNVAQLIEWARHADPPLQYASLGIGSVSHLAGELLAIEAGIRLEHVPYTDSARAYPTILRGDLPLAFVTLESARPYMRSQRLRALGVTSARRAAGYPQVPAIAESLPGFELVGFYGFVAPAGTPAPFIATLSAEIMRTLQTPRIRDQLAAGALDVSVAPPAAFAAFLREQIDKYTLLARRTGITLDS